MNNSICQEKFLIDKSASGRIRPWAEHKYMNSYLALAYNGVDERKAERLRQCATWLLYHKGAEGMKLHNANFCRVRLCPICQWRRSLKVYSQMTDIINKADEMDFRYIFLTLTVRNCAPSELSSTLDSLMEGFRRLMQYADIKRAVKGYYRGTEITHNITEDTYHPHMHVVLAVNKSYFSSKDYIRHDKWVALWRRAMKLDYNPMVNVKPFKTNMSQAIAEVAKYSLKPGEYVIADDWDLTCDTVRVLDGALNNRRFVGLGGIFKEIHEQLNLDDLEDGDLVGADEKPQEIGKDFMEVIYWWHSGYSQYISEG